MKFRNYLKIAFSICLLVLNGAEAANAQSFDVLVSSDTILAGNVVNLTFAVDNLEGEFVAPDLSAYKVVSGPNVSNQVSVINGVVTRKGNYSYSLVITEEGEVVIPAAELQTEEATYETAPTRIMVLANPEGIIERPPVESGMLEFNLPGTPRTPNPPAKKKRKKRKLRKI